MSLKVFANFSWNFLCWQTPVYISRFYVDSWAIHQRDDCDTPFPALAKYHTSQFEHFRVRHYVLYLHAHTHKPKIDIMTYFKGTRCIHSKLECFLKYKFISKSWLQNLLFKVIAVVSYTLPPTLWQLDEVASKEFLVLLGTWHRPIFLNFRKKRAHAPNLAPISWCPGIWTSCMPKRFTTFRRHNQFASYHCLVCWCILIREHQLSLYLLIFWAFSRKSTGQLPRLFSVSGARKSFTRF